MTKLYERLAGLNAFVGVLALVIGLAAVPEAKAVTVIRATDCAPSCSGCSLVAPCGSSVGTCTGSDCTSGCICIEDTDTLTGQQVCRNACTFRYNYPGDS